MNTLFPPDASLQGFQVDRLFYLALGLTGAAFLAVLAILAYFMVRYRACAHPRAVYDDGEDTRSKRFTAAFACLVFIGIDLNLAWQDHKAWSALFSNPGDAAHALKIHVTGERFTWTFLYPGPRGEFGPPDGREEYVLRVPAGRPVILYITSKDVVHSLFIPNLRLKMDAVPGMTTSMRFIAVKPGTYQIACAEMCGAQHHQMGSQLIVQAEDEYEKWEKGGGDQF